MTQNTLPVFFITDLALDYDLMVVGFNSLYLVQLSPYGPEDGRVSPISPQSSPCGSPASPTLASLQSSGGYYGSSPTNQSFLGMSAGVSPGSSPNTSMGGFGTSQNYGEPPRKIFSEVAFEDLSASFKNLYKSVFDASHGGDNYGKHNTSHRREFFTALLRNALNCHFLL